MDYKNKYLKYKIKYLNFKKIFGGTTSDDESDGLPRFTEQIQKYTTTMLNQARSTNNKEKIRKLEEKAESKHAQLYKQRQKRKKKKIPQSQDTIIRQGNKFSDETTVNYNIVPSHKLREGESQNLGNLFKGMSHHKQDNVRLESQAPLELGSEPRPEPQARRRFSQPRLELGSEPGPEPQARRRFSQPPLELGSEPGPEPQARRRFSQARLELGSESEEEQQSKRPKLGQEEPESSSIYNLFPSLNIFRYLGF